MAAAVANDAELVQCTRRRGNAFAPHTKHEREELLGEIERVPPADAIVRHEKPARAALIDRVQAVAGHRLSELVDERLRVTTQEGIQRWTLRDRLCQGEHGEALGIAVDLHETAS